MQLIFSHSKFINFIVQTAVQQADIVALWLSIAVAVSLSVAARQSVSLWPAGSHWWATGWLTGLNKNWPWIPVALGYSNP